jgi:hypothetical protein
MARIERTSKRPAPAGLPTLSTTVLRRRSLAPPTLLLGAALLWAWSLTTIDPNRMSDFGLISVLPIPFMVALVLLTLAFAVTVARSFERYSRALLTLEIVLLALILYGTPAFVEVVPRSGTMWQHLGVADYIVRHGAVDKTIDAYFNWPGFFVALAFVQRVTGLTSLAGIGAWAPLFFNLLDAIVLFNLVKLGARQERAAWFAVWIFLCTNWVGQDILSPQAFSYFIYLNILLLAMVAAPAARRRLLSPRILQRARSQWPGRWLRALPTFVLPRASEPSLAGAATEGWASSRAQRLLVTLTITVLFGAVAISHQLTPYTIAIVVGAFVIANVSSIRLMPILMTLIIFVWFTYSAVPFLQQFLHHEVSGFGEVRQNLSASVTARFSGTREHELIVYLRLLMTALLWGLATLSAAVRLSRGRRDVAFIALGIAPFVLAGLQSYGGEIALRIYLFTLPAAAFFVAASLTSAFEAGHSRRIALAVTALSFVFLPLFLVARYGNERLDYFTRGEYETVRALYRLSPPGSQFFVLDGDLPWRWQRYGSDRTFTLYEFVRIYSTELRVTPNTIANTMRDSRRPAFLIFTPTQTTYASYIGGVAPETITRFKQLIADSPRFERIYKNKASVIYRLARRSPT